MSQSLTVAPTVAERRVQRAEVLASIVDKWLPVTFKDGRSAWAIPSQSVAGKFHIATHDRCGCWDSVRRSGRCKHQLAVRIILRQHGLWPVAQPSSTPDVFTRFEEAA